LRNAYFKGHGLGNDYIAVDPAELDFALTPKIVRALCDRHRGVGGDGLLVIEPSQRAHFGLRIFNPDGSEAEKSGNGLRIFAAFLHSTRRTRRRRIRIETPAGIASVALRLGEHGEPDRANVVIGHASFQPARLPCTLDVPELIDQPLEVGGRNLLFTGVSVGNPHCVVFASDTQEWTRDDLLELGPLLEEHEIFPNRTNVQLAAPVAPRTLSILVWERGAGETLASGTSACAAAAAGVRLGLVKSPVAVHAPGGALEVAVDENFDLTLDGEVAEVMRGQLSPAFLRTLE
jgi:diaminopimelate epimerase